jgi:hypothetical protein
MAHFPRPWGHDARHYCPIAQALFGEHGSSGDKERLLAYAWSLLFPPSRPVIHSPPSPSFLPSFRPSFLPSFLSSLQRDTRHPHPHGAPNFNAPAVVPYLQHLPRHSPWKPNLGHPACTPQKGAPNLNYAPIMCIQVAQPTMWRITSTPRRDLRFCNPQRVAWAARRLVSDF